MINRSGSLLPAFDYVFIKRESLQGFEALGEAVCIQEVSNMIEADSNILITRNNRAFVPQLAINFP